MAEVFLVGAGLVLAAFLLRTAVHLGRSPGGVDTWYFLAYAEAARRERTFRVRLPQYLLQDEVQSYPPLFPALLSLLPPAWLRRRYWVVSPAIDCLHLALLYGLTYRMAQSLTVSVLAGVVYAATPLLVSETRSLNPRSLAALLHTGAMLLTLSFVISGQAWPWLPLALGAVAALLLASATGAAAYLFVCGSLCVVLRDLRYLLVAVGAGALALLISRGHLLKVARNYVHALAYWRRNRHNFGAHPLHDSPLYGTPRPRDSPASHPGLLGSSTGPMLVRLAGENPFLLVLMLAPRGLPPWGTRLFLWAASLTVLAVVATLVPPLRAFGPGRGFLKAAIFPTAYTLAVGIGGLPGLGGPLGLATLAALGLSLAAIGFFYRHVRRRATVQTVSTPPGLDQSVHELARLPGRGVFCLPYMYADYVCYHSGKRVLWGGHCGDLRRFEALAPVITRPLPELLESYDVRYLLLDRLYAGPAELGLETGLELLGRYAAFELYEWRPGAR
jgi:hypothetical protein